MTSRYVAFSRTELLAEGPLTEVAAAAKQACDAGRSEVLVFDAETSEPIELDMRGSADDVLARLPLPPADPEIEAGGDALPETGQPKRPGRPKLGVVAREVTLLPRHWEWLASQPGGASVTLRKLVEKARLAGADEDRQRRSRDATYRFMFALAGNEPGFEEASRALFAGDEAAFAENTETWPGDVRDHARRLAAASFGHALERD